MKAAIYESFSTRPLMQEVPDPELVDDGVVIQIMGSGVCRSDWHAWGGHDPVVKLHHVPGHELAGIVESVGRDVQKWRLGDRVTVPFVVACGRCSQCASGNQQVCDRQFQPGFTHWGAFAQYVAIHHADVNLVRLAESMTFATAASLGCRFVTAYRAVVDQSNLKPGQWIAVFGCGGVGLSAIMIARARGGRVIAVDIDEGSLALAQKLGAECTINASKDVDAIKEVHDISEGGAHVSIDALGITDTCVNSVRSLRKRGRHIQIGWMLGNQSTPPIPMDLVMGNELEIVGSHGMAAYRYPEMMQLIECGELNPEALIGQEISLDQSADALADFETFNKTGITVITSFD